jgi:acyl carrier protein phosphodiesterase
MIKFDRTWGVIQRLNVEADTLAALRGAVSIAMSEHKKVTHFRVETLTDKPLPSDWGDDHDPNLAGSTRLTLLWTRDRATDNELPFELTTVDEVVAFCQQWLEKKGSWPTIEPDTDGSTHAGFRISKGNTFAAAFDITPIWIVYGK